MVERAAASTDPPGKPISGLALTMLLVAAITAVSAFATLLTVWARSQQPDAEQILKFAAVEYSAGRPAISAGLARTIQFDDTAGSDDADAMEELRARRDFFIGAGTAASADPDDDLAAWRLALDQAIPYLQSAQKLGFPQGFEGEGGRLLGIALFSQGEHGEAAKSLGAAIKIAPAERLQLQPLLIEAQLRAGEVIGNAAVESAERWLEWLPADSPQIEQAKLFRGRGLLKDRQWPAARQQFRQVIDEGKKQDVVLEATLWEVASHIAQAEASVERSDQRELDQLTRETLEDCVSQLTVLERELPPDLVAQASLWAVKAHQLLGQVEEAILAATNVRQHRPFNAEAAAGGLLEAELLVQQRRPDEVLQAVRYLVREIGDPRSFDGRLMRLEDYRGRITEVADHLADQASFEVAVDLVRGLPPLLALDDALTLEGKIFSQWAGSLANRDGESAGSTFVIGREQYRAAGDAHAAAAKLRFTSKSYVPTLWAAIDAYEHAGDLERTLELVDLYLKYEDRRMLPRGLLTKGRVLLSLGQPAAALAPLMDCVVEYPRDALRYEARLLAAMGHSEQRQIDAARELLETNLFDGTLEPESPVWRDSLYFAGQLTFHNAYQNHLRLIGKLPSTTKPGDVPHSSFPANQTQLELAVQRLEEFAEREGRLLSEDRPDSSAPVSNAKERVYNAKYLAAQSRRMAAHWPAVEALSPDLLDTARRRLLQTRDEHLQRAKQGFDSLRGSLGLLEERQTLSPSMAAILRNASLASADVLRDMGKLQEAVEVYRGISLRYMNEPTALEAMLGQSRCLEDLGQSLEASRVLRQAERVLDRIPAAMDDQFATTTRQSREQWQRFLGWLIPATTPEEA